jgi:iron complex transport system ATP-binding protein
VVLSNLIVGRGNLKNLEAALHAAKLGKLFVIERDEFERRNFAGSEALEIYGKMKSILPKSRILKDERELPKIFEELTPS